MELHNGWGALPSVDGTLELRMEEAFGHEEECLRKYPGDNRCTSHAA